ncbi:unnamed protein product [Amoebophrya sp. A25]|nr:unnamed protein product [Amoebophrya sp. A25]|eukprot:GSA25T00014859001.1
MKCRKYLDLSKRVSIVNQRLEIIKELYEMLHNEITIESGHRLEWIVILLVFANVIVDILAVMVDMYRNPYWGPWLLDILAVRFWPPLLRHVLLPPTTSYSRPDMQADLIEWL